MNEEYSLGIISDPHSNLAGLEAVLEDMASKYPITRIINIGDLVGYYTQPREVMDLCLDVCDVIVKGNHDDAAARSFLPTDFNTFAAIALNYTISTLSTKEKRLIYNLPTIENFVEENTSFQLVHGSPNYPLDEYIFDGPNGATEDQLQLIEYMDLLGLDVLVMGHTHKPYIREFEGKVLCNPGSAGQPRDRDPRVSYIVFDPLNRKGIIERVSYNLDITIDLVKEAGLPKQLGERLRNGK